MVVNLCGDQIYADFVRFLIHEDLYAWCLRYNIYSAWFLDIRISTCLIYHDVRMYDTTLKKLHVHLHLENVTPHKKL